MIWSASPGAPSARGADATSPTGPSPPALLRSSRSTAPPGRAAAGPRGSDPVDPRGQGGAFVEAVARAKQLREDVLDDLRGIGGAAGDAVRQAVYPGRVHEHERLERVLVAVPEPLDQEPLGVTGGHDVHH